MQAFVAFLDADVARLAVRSLLLDGLERSDGGNVEQEGKVALGEARHGLLYASGGLFGREDAVEDAVVARVDGERCLVALHRGPEQVGVVALELGINQVLVALAGNGVVVVLLPDAVPGARNAVLPHAVRAAAHPAHARAGRFGIGEGQAQVIDLGVHEGVVEAAPAGSAVQQDGVHVEQAVVGQAPDDGVGRALIPGAEDGAVLTVANVAERRLVAHLHAHGHGAVLEGDVASARRHAAEQAGRGVERHADVGAAQDVAAAFPDGFGPRQGLEGHWRPLHLVREVLCGQADRVAPGAEAAAFLVEGFQLEHIAVGKVGGQFEARRARLARSDGGQRHLAFGQGHGSSGDSPLQGRVALQDAPVHAAVLQVGVGIFIGQQETAVEMRSDEQRLQLDGRPLRADGIVAALLLAARAYHAVGGVRFVRVEDAVLVRALRRLVTEDPDKSASKHGVRQPAVPEVAQAGASALVVHGVHELRGHEHLVAVREAGHTRQVGRIVVRVQVVEVGPGMDDVALLQLVVACEQRVGVVVPSTLVAVAPENDTGMVDVAAHHLAHQLGAYLRVVSILPSGQLVQIDQAQRVTHVEEMFVGRIVRTDGVHVHLLDEHGILTAHGRARGAPAIHRERVAVDALHHQLHAVQVQSVLREELNGTEAHAEFTRLHHPALAVFQLQLGHVQVGVLRVPQADAAPLRGEQLLAFAVPDDVGYLRPSR